MLRSDPGAFARPVLDALPQHIAVIDRSGRIVWTNRAWRAFGAANGGDPGATGEGASYFDTCDRSLAAGEPDAGQALSRLRSVAEGSEAAAYFEYSCHSPEERRWFLMRACPIDGTDGLFAVTHENITERKLAELHVEHLAMLDGLTGIPNRRRFDEVLDDEWRRARRTGGHVSLILLDVDEFKAFNDSRGHLAGDDCLRRVAGALAPLAGRPGDLVARYGGEEFAIILGGTDAAGAATLAEKARQAVSDLAIPQSRAGKDGHVTISAGVATFRLAPRSRGLPRDLQRAADDCLYRAKREGRNRVCSDGAVRIGRAAG